VLTFAVMNANLRPLHALLSAMKALLNGIEESCSLIASGNQAEAEEAVVGLEALSKSLDQAQIALSQNYKPGDDDEAMLAEMGALAGRISAGQKTIQEWLVQQQVEVLSPEEVARAESVQVSSIADSLLHAKWDPQIDLLVLVGPECEALAQELVRRGQRYLILYLSEGEAGEAWPSGFSVCQSMRELEREVGAIRCRRLSKITAYSLPDTGVSAQLVNEVGVTAQRVVEAVAVAQRTHERMGELWVKNSMNNLPAVAANPSVDALIPAMRGQAVVIVSPGPSLDKNIAQLAELKGHALILCTNHAFAAMMKAGVMPDMVISFDPQDLSHHFENWPFDDIEAIILSTSVAPNLFSLGAKHVFSFPDSSEFDSFTYRKISGQSQLQGGGSVACVSMSLAMLWGCSPIIFVGQDLSFKDGSYYSSLSCDSGIRTVESSDGSSFTFKNDVQGLREVGPGDDVRAEMPIVELPGYYGGTIKSRPLFALFMRWLESATAACEEGVEVFNCTEGGVHIQGMQHIPLAEAVLRLSNRELDVAGMCAAATQNTDLLTRSEEFRDLLNHIEQALQRMMALLDKLGEQVERARGDPKEFNELIAMERLLDGNSDAMVMLSMYRQKALMEMVESRASLTGTEEIIESSVALYGILREATEGVRKFALEALNRLN